jgi:glycosyltransferase involved in cell wall biosynthesis
MQQLKYAESLFLFDEEPGTHEKRMLESHPLTYRVLRGVRVHFLPFVQARFGRVFPFDLFRALRSFRPNVVFAPEYSVHTVICLTYSILFRKKLVVWASLTELDERISFRGQRILRRLIRRYADTFVCYSDLAMEYLRRNHVLGEKCFKVENCTDVKYFLDEYRPRKIPQVPIRLLYVGALVKEKGLLDLIDALYQIGDLPWRLLVAGEGELEAKIRLSFANERRATMLGTVHRDKLPEVYGQSDVFVFPSHSDVWGHVIDEAMAMGCAVVASDHTVAARELIVDGENGFLFETGNIQFLASQLGLLINNPREIRDAGHAAHETMFNHTESNSVLGIERAIKHALAS